MLALAVFAGPLVACVSLSNPRSLSIVHGTAAMFFGGLLVHFRQGPMQMEMHSYFFSLIAVLAIFGNPVVIVAAAVTVALHHLALWFLVPRSVFNYDAPVWVVGVRAMFVVLESVAACHIARTFFHGVTRLERLVQTLRRNQDLRLLLDNVDQGFATIDRHGILSAERSKAFDRWFPDAPDTIFVALGSLSPDFAIRTQLSWEAVVDGILPLELLLDQMPKRFATAETHFDVTYIPIASGAGESPEKFLVVITDVTAEVRREVSEREWREVLHLFERLSDRTGVQEYFEKANALVAAITGGEELERTTLGRKLHTRRGAPTEALRPREIASIASRTDEGMLGDVLGEFANMLLGRLKNKLLPRGVELLLGTPTTALGRELALTPSSETELVHRAKSLNAKGWIIKPFKAELLVAAAEEARAAHSRGVNESCRNAVSAAGGRGADHLASGCACSICVVRLTAHVSDGTAAVQPIASLLQAS